MSFRADLKCLTWIILQGSRCGIYGANSPEWIITMEVKSCSTGRIILIIVVTSNYFHRVELLEFLLKQSFLPSRNFNSAAIFMLQACNAHGIYCVPLYDTLGIYPDIFIIWHG
jgi:hypothetical protein